MKISRAQHTNTVLSIHVYLWEVNLTSAIFDSPWVLDSSSALSSRAPAETKVNAAIATDTKDEVANLHALLHLHLIDFVIRSVVLFL